MWLHLYEHELHRQYFPAQHQWLTADQVIIFFYSSNTVLSCNPGLNILDVDVDVDMDCNERCAYPCQFRYIEVLSIHPRINSCWRIMYNILLRFIYVLYGCTDKNFAYKHSWWFWLGPSLYLMDFLLCVLRDSEIAHGLYSPIYSWVMVSTYSFYVCAFCFYMFPSLPFSSTNGTREYIKEKPFRCRIMEN